MRCVVWVVLGSLYLVGLTARIIAKSAGCSIKTETVCPKK